jgi:hypothetical protein
MQPDESWLTVTRWPLTAGSKATRAARDLAESTAALFSSLRNRTGAVTAKKNAASPRVVVNLVFGCTTNGAG